MSWMEMLISHVIFGNGSNVAILGKWSILFDCKNSDQNLLNEVYITFQVLEITSLVSDK